ncbi:MAG: glutamate--tRNA ligase family protein, partial [bacterium]|nr:glutamate--tRNA ligase family protein [bacterium]
EMQISHVIRGEEFLPSTPIHLQIYEAFGWETPKFIHLPLILDRERKKLSKRTGDVAVKEYIEKGYLPQPLLNFIALLGWNPKSTKEIFSLDELISEFAVEKLNKAAAILDLDKLDFLNRQWQKKLNLGEKDPLNRKTHKLLVEKFGNPSLSPSPHEGRVGEGSRIHEIFSNVWPIILERIRGPSDLEERLPEFKFFFEEPEYDSQLLIWKDTPNERIKENLQKLLGLLQSTPSLNPSHQGREKSGDDSSPLVGEGRWGDNLENEILNLLTEQGIGKGEALWPLRVALSGLKNSPSPFEIIEAFTKMPNGREIVLQRIQKAIEKLS